MLEEIDNLLKRELLITSERSPILVAHLATQVTTLRRLEHNHVRKGSVSSFKEFTNILYKPAMLNSGMKIPGERVATKPQ
jgi:hypothetical protein